MFDPETPDHVRFLQNIRSNNFEQKLSVYMKINQIFTNSVNYEKIFPIIREQLPQEHEDIQIEAAKNTIECMKNTKLEKEQYHELLNQCVIIHGLWNVKVINHWVGVYDQVLLNLPYNEIEKSCYEQVVSLSENSQPMQSKYAAAKLIGIMAERVKDKIAFGVALGVSMSSQVFVFVKMSYVEW